MKLISTLKLASSLALGAALVGCAGTVEQAPDTSVRTRAPQGYEKTITNYLAFRIRGAPKNVEINFGTPEPSGCALDGYLTSSRGWVVPVVYATRTGAPTGKETINIATRQYFFWFLGDTIAGLTPRIDLCPGATVTEFPQPTPAGESTLAAAAVASPARADAPAREGAADAEGAKTARGSERAKPVGAQTTQRTADKKKTGRSSAARGKAKKHAKAQRRI